MNGSPMHFLTDTDYMGDKILDELKTSDQEEQARERKILDGYPETKGLSLKRDDRRKDSVLRLSQMAGVPVLTFPKLEQCKMVKHLFTTRAGGVSQGQFLSMNFSSKLGDEKDRVLENFRRVARAMDCELEDMTGTVQTHTANIQRMEEMDRGKGILRDPDTWDLDGLITNAKGVTLVAYMADCVPIFFADPVKEAVGIAHAGWRGTVQNMAGKMAEHFQREFGTDPKDLVVGIGPSICQDCYEVDEAVASAFREALGEDEEERRRIADSGCYPMEGYWGDGLRRVVEPGRQNGKYQLDLQLANLIFLARAGIDLGKVDVTDLCTAENPKILFSHRATGGKRGNMGGFIRLI